MGGVLNYFANGIERKDSLKNVINDFETPVRVRPCGIAQVGFDIERKLVK